MSNEKKLLKEKNTILSTFKNSKWAKVTKVYKKDVEHIGVILKYKLMSKNFYLEDVMNIFDQKASDVNNNRMGKLSIV